MFKNLKIIFMIYAIIILSLMVVSWITLLNLFTFKYEVIVNDTQTTYNKNIGDSDFLVFTNVTTFKVDDSILLLRFDSSDFFGKIKKGACYRISALGFRIPILTIYPNISAMEEINCKPLINTSSTIVDVMVDELSKTTNPDIRNDILNSLDCLRKTNPNFHDKHKKIINQHDNEWVVLT